MRLILLSVLLFTGCSADYIAKRDANRDHEYCVSVGATSQEMYYHCRQSRAYARAQDQARADAMMLGLLGVASQQNPPPQPAVHHGFTCIQQGVFTNCY